MKPPALGLIFLAASRLFGLAVGGTCTSYFALTKPTHPAQTTTYSSTFYGATETVTFTFPAYTADAYGHSQVVRTTLPRGTTYWATTAPTTTTVAAPSTFTPITSVKNATTYATLVLCNSHTTLSGQTTTVSTGVYPTPATVTQTFRTKTTTTTSFVISSFTTTSTVHTDVVTVFDACQSDNWISKYHDEYVFYAQAAQGTSPQGMSCDNEYWTDEQCTFIRAAFEGPRQCCHAAWSLYYSNNPAPYAFLFSNIGPAPGVGACTGFMSGDDDYWDFYTGPHGGGEDNRPNYVGNGPGGHGYYRGYTTSLGDGFL